MLRLRAQPSAERNKRKFQRKYYVYATRQITLQQPLTGGGDGAGGQTDVDIDVVVGCAQCGGIQMVKAILHMSKGDKRDETKGKEEQTKGKEKSP